MLCRGTNQVSSILRYICTRRGQVIQSRGPVSACKRAGDRADTLVRSAKKPGHGAPRTETPRRQHVQHGWKSACFVMVNSSLVHRRPECGMRDVGRGYDSILEWHICTSCGQPVCAGQVELSLSMRFYGPLCNLSGQMASMLQQSNSNHVPCTGQSSFHVTGMYRDC